MNEVEQIFGEDYPNDIEKTVDLLMEGDQIVFKGLKELFMQRNDNSISVASSIIVELKKRQEIAEKKYRQAMDTVAKLARDGKGKDQESKAEFKNLETVISEKAKIDSIVKEFDR